MDIIRAARLVPNKVRATNPMAVGKLDMLSVLSTLAPPTPPKTIQEAEERRQEFVDYEQRKKQAVPLLRFLIDKIAKQDAKVKKLSEDEEESISGLVLSFIGNTARMFIGKAVKFGAFLLKGVLRLAVSIATSLLSVVARVLGLLLANPVAAAVVGIAALGFGAWYYYKNRKGADTPASSSAAANDGSFSSTPVVAKPMRLVSKESLSDKPVGPSSSGGGQVSKAAAGSVKQATAFFVSKGWTPEQAAGIAANLYCESAMRPDAKGDYVGGTATAYGIAQWHRDRRLNFEKQYGKSMIGSSFEEQLAFVDLELRTTESKAGNLLKKTTTAADAGAVVSMYYERPANRDAEANKRGQLAQNLTRSESTALASAGKSNSEVQTTKLAQASPVSAKPKQEPAPMQLAAAEQAAPKGVGGSTEAQTSPSFIRLGKKQPLLRIAA